MQSSFEFSINANHVLFGDGALQQLPEMIAELKCQRALILSTPQQKSQADQLHDLIGSLCVGVFDQATMHTPIDVTEQAVALVKQLDVDLTIAIGGGSTTGLGKAISYRTGLPQIVIPTTYAGSEVTPILGQTENGIKTTVVDKKIQPDVVIYDPQLTYGLPVNLTVTSALNAVAHSIEALYSKDRNPIATMMAVEGTRAIVEGLPLVVKDPHDAEGRRNTLYGAWLCGTVLGLVGMALHHKLCHTLGGLLNLPHAETHAILLPHTIAFNEVQVPELMQPIAEVLNTNTVGVGLYNLAQTVSAPQALKDIGMNQQDIVRASELAVKNPYWNPRPFSQAQIQALIENAYWGRAPEPL